MSGYDLKNGLLPFPLSFLASDGGTVAAAFVENNPTVEVDSTNWFVVCMTTQEMVDLQSVLAVGAPIALPETYNEIIQFWMQVREYPNEIPEGSCMDLCQLILDCINTTPGIQQAIAAYSLSTPVIAHEPQNQTIMDSQLIDDPAGCDNDIIFGMTTGITDLINHISEDMLDIFVQAASPSGRIGDMIEAIPGIGILPIDDIFQFVESVMDDFQSSYDAAYTSQLRDDIRCDLFCLAVDDCELTMEQLRDYFQDKLTASISIDFWDGFIDDLIENFYSGVQAVWGLGLLITQAIIVGGSITGYDIDKVVTSITAMLNDPDSDWSILCTGCGWTYNSDWDTAEETWIPSFAAAPYDDPQAIWSSGNGFDSVDVQQSAGSWGRMDAINRAIADTHINNVELTYDMTKGAFTGPSAAAVAITCDLVAGGQDVQIISYTSVSNGSGQTFNSPVNAECDRVWVLSRCSRQPTEGALSGACKSESVEIDGVGTNPFE